MIFQSNLLKWMVLPTFLLIMGCECILCGAEVKPSTPTSGKMLVEVQNLVNLAPNDGSTDLVNIQFVGNNISPIGESGSTTFDTSRSKEVKKGDNTPATLNRTGLRPGVWEVKVYAGTWNASCTVAINANSSSSAVFRYGSSGCN